MKALTACVFLLGCFDDFPDAVFLVTDGAADARSNDAGNDRGDTALDAQPGPDVQNADTALPQVADTALPPLDAAEVRPDMALQTPDAQAHDAAEPCAPDAPDAAPGVELINACGTACVVARDCAVQCPGIETPEEIDTYESGCVLDCISGDVDRHCLAGASCEAVVAQINAASPFNRRLCEGDAPLRDLSAENVGNNFAARARVTCQSTGESCVSDGPDDPCWIRCPEGSQVEMCCSNGSACGGRDTPPAEPPLQGMNAAGLLDLTCEDHDDMQLCRGELGAAVAVLQCFYSNDDPPPP